MKIKVPSSAWLLVVGALVVCLGCGRPAPAPAAEPSASPAPAPESSPSPPPEQAARPEAPAPEERPAVTQVQRPRPSPVPPPHRQPPPVKPAEVAPPPPPPPQVIVKTLPMGTNLDLAFIDGLSSETSAVGDAFRAQVAHDVTWDGMVVIPAGSVVHGEVTEVQSLKKIGGTAKLGLHFAEIELPGGRVPIDASIAQQGKSETKKDAATIGGAAAGGALLGRILAKKTKGAVIGAVVGAAAGTAVAAKTKGEQVEIAAGSELPVQLNQPVQITLTKR